MPALKINIMDLSFILEPKKVSKGLKHFTASLHARLVPRQCENWDTHVNVVEFPHKLQFVICLKIPSRHV